MPKANDTQAILVSSTSQRENGSLYPLPDMLKTGARAKVLASLLASRLAEERETPTASETHRSDGDVHHGL